MDDTPYRTWWALHLRAARGEHLSAEEHAAYAAGLRHLHHEESLAEEVATLRQARAMVAAFATEQAQWHAQREPLAAEIAALEAALGEHTRQLLGVKD